MHILTVDMKDCAFSAETGMFHATLLMATDTRRMALRTSVAYREGMHRSDLAETMLAAALQQLSDAPAETTATRPITVARDAFRVAPPAQRAA